ncbi:MAG: GNAT family N-acetyltransferase [Planctomycetota bacterium]|nr:GNAT family N-acetyltransferase [Planctomycetota bacterium]MDA1180215.1 GNAT family N-acetyltransferase [Planctomycetota bacterium]
MSSLDVSQTSPVLALSKGLLPTYRSCNVDHLIYRVWPGNLYRHKWLELQNTVWKAITGRPVDWDEAWFDREFSAATGAKVIWIALGGGRSDGPLMGSVVLDLSDTNTSSTANVRSIRAAAKINWLAVLPECRRAGIGSTLVRLAEKEAWQRGCVESQVETLVTWQPAVQLYKRLGYSTAVNEDGDQA